MCVLDYTNINLCAGGDKADYHYPYIVEHPLLYRKMSRCLDPTSYTAMLEPLKWICGFYLFTFLVKYMLNSHSTQKKTASVSER